MLNFQLKKGRKGHQWSNLEWHYIQKIMSPGVLFVWKIFILVSETAQGWYYAALLVQGWYYAALL